MKKQLLLSKRICLEGCEFAERGDSVSSGLAISLFQDAVEMFVWALIKERNLSIKENAQFTTNMDSLSKAGIKLSFIPQMFELNKSRVGFKHYGNLPAVAEAAKFRAYVEEFLRVSFEQCFGLSLEDLSLVDLVVFDDVRGHLKRSEKFVVEAQYIDAIAEAAKAKVILFSKLNRFIPRVGQHLILEDEFELLREAVLAALVRIPLQDFAFIMSALPKGSISYSGNVSIGLGTSSYDAAHCKRAIECLVALSIRMESLV